MGGPSRAAPWTRSWCCPNRGPGLTWWTRCLYTNISPARYTQQHYPRSLDRDTAILDEREFLVKRGSLLSMGGNVPSTTEKLLGKPEPSLLMELGTRSSEVETPTLWVVGTDWSVPSRKRISWRWASDFLALKWRCSLMTWKWGKDGGNGLDRKWLEFRRGFCNMNPTTQQRRRGVFHLPVVQHCLFW